LLLNFPLSRLAGQLDLLNQAGGLLIPLLLTAWIDTSASV
jgi:hypothetical protein